MVTPRYGREVTGGAELGARLLAERLVERLGWTVDVLTTNAVSERTWAPELAVGTTVEHGVQVHRHAVQGQRHRRFDALTATVMRRPQESSPEAAWQWLSAQGPVSPTLIDAIASTDADAVAFTPYLFHPTVAGLPRVADRALLHPAAHDEWVLRLPVYPPVFRAARGLVHYTEGEAAVVASRVPGATGVPRLVLGMGVDEAAGTPAQARAALGALGDRPFVLCLGRVDEQKGAHWLARAFAEYKREHPGPLALVLAGPVAQPVDPHPDVVVTGFVDDDVKWGLLRGAELLVQPSSNESFSFVVLESWLAGRPVIVHAGCPATREHAAASGGGVWMDGTASLFSALDRLLSDERLRAVLAQRGRAYVLERYTWDAVVSRYASFLGSLRLGGGPR
jgi:glycosyltransferase involved in cell wall biosynthesis